MFMSHGVRSHRLWCVAQIVPLVLLVPLQLQCIKYCDSHVKIILCDAGNLAAYIENFAICYFANNLKRAHDGANKLKPPNALNCAKEKQPCSRSLLYSTI